MVVCAAPGATAAPVWDETCAALSALNQQQASAIAAMLGIKRVRRVFIESALSVNASLADCVSHAINRQHVCRNAIVDLVGLRVADDVLERRLHNGIELLVDH